MAVKIRLARRGRRKQPYYHIIVADARAPRDGKFIEQIGSYNPMTKPATIELDRDKAYDWLMKGAQPTETARAILRFKGVLYKKHLQRGVSKGAMSQEEADRLFGEYVDAKEAKVAERFEQTKQERLEFLKKVSGSPKKVYVEETAATAALSDFQEGGESAVETPAGGVETPEAPAEEVEAPEVKGEAPTAEAEAPAVEAEASAPVTEEAVTEEVAAVEETVTEEAPVVAAAAASVAATVSSEEE